MLARNKEVVTRLLVSILGSPCPTVCYLSQHHLNLHLNHHPKQHLDQHTSQQRTQQLSRPPVSTSYKTLPTRSFPLPARNELVSNFKMIPRLLRFAGVILCGVFIIQLATGDFNDIAKSAEPKRETLHHYDVNLSKDLQLVFAYLQLYHDVLMSTSPYLGLVFDKCLVFGTWILFEIGFHLRYMYNLVVAVNAFWVQELCEKEVGDESLQYTMKALVVLLEAFGLELILRKTLPIWRTIINGRNFLTIAAIGVAFLTGWDLYKSGHVTEGSRLGCCAPNFYGSNQTTQDGHCELLPPSSGGETGSFCRKWDPLRWWSCKKNGTLWKLGFSLTEHGVRHLSLHLTHGSCQSKKMVFSAGYHVRWCTHHLSVFTNNPCNRSCENKVLHPT